MIGKIVNFNEYRKSEEASMLWKLYQNVSEVTDSLNYSSRSAFSKQDYEEIANEIIMFHTKIEQWLVKGGYAHFAEE